MTPRPVVCARTTRDFIRASALGLFGFWLPLAIAIWALWS
jgi:hypothetical protein